MIRTPSRKLLAIVTLLLLLLAASNVIMALINHGIINIVYSAYLVFGLLACILAYKAKTSGLILLIIFYSIQTVRVFSPEFNYNFTTGITLFFSVFEGNIQSSTGRTGFAVNLISVAMIMWCVISLWGKNRKPIKSHRADMHG